MKQTTINERGNALLIVLMVLLVVGTWIAATFSTTIGTSLLTARGRDLAQVQAAADGALEYAFAAWKGRMVQNDRPLIPSELGSFNSAMQGSGGFQPPAGISFLPASSFGPLQIRLTNPYGSPVTDNSMTAPQVPFRTLTLTSHPGWRGRTISYIATTNVEASSLGSNKVRSGVKRTFEYSVVPLFQAMWFFEHNLELYKPADMMVSGLVHTNSDLFATYNEPNKLTFLGNVSYAGKYNDSTPPPGGAAWSPPDAGSQRTPAYGDGGKDQQLNKTDRMEPLGKTPVGFLSKTDDTPNNDSMREIIEKVVPGKAETPEIRKRRMHEKSSVVITINHPVAGAGGATQATITVAGKNGASVTTQTATKIAGSLMQKRIVRDRRENADVNMSTLDMSKLSPALNEVSGFNGLVYIDHAGAGIGDKPAVRLRNGGELAQNLTVATEGGMYIQGDYNSGAKSTSSSDVNQVPSNNGGNASGTDLPYRNGYNKKSSAVIADMVTILSNSWNDDNASLGIDKRVASTTTVNTAIMAGFLPSGYDPDGSGPQSAYGYSGGANNFPRFLEDWRGKYLTYFGSMVELFESARFTGRWDTGQTYQPPIRRWTFDSSFINDPPPGSLDGITYSRGSFERF